MSARADVALMMSQMTSAEIKCWHVGAWACDHSVELLGQRLKAPMAARFPRFGRSAELDLSGTCENTIEASFTTGTVLAVVLMMSDSSTMVTVGLEPKMNTKMCPRFNGEWLQLQL